MDTQKQKRSAFSGKIGFVLSAAGASVGLGNIWRFPYLAAKYGGGIFSAGVHRAGRHLWLHDDRGRNGTGPHDPQKARWVPLELLAKRVACGSAAGSMRSFPF